jgi:peptidyl-prolyl cis-trans isomerase C
MRMRCKAVALSLFLGSMAAAEPMATVNGTTIDSKDVEAVVMEGTQGAFPNLPQEKQDQLRNKIVEGMIMQELIFEDAKEKGLLDAPSYQAELKEMVERLERQLAARAWEENIFNNIEVDEKEVRADYDKNVQQYDVPETVHARHILLPSEGEAREVINDLKSLSGTELQQKFIQTAVSRSKGPSGPKGGDLGRFPRGQMVPEFDEAVFGLKPGTITQTPVKTQFGYHVIFLEEKFEPKKYSFDEVKGFIEKKLKNDKFKAAVEQQTKALHGAAKITYGK